MLRSWLLPRSTASIVGIKDKSLSDVKKELKAAMGQDDLDAVIDCTGAPEVIKLGMSLLAISGHYVDVGLVGDRIDIPLLLAFREQTFHALTGATTRTSWK